MMIHSVPKRLLLSQTTLQIPIHTAVSRCHDLICPLSQELDVKTLSLLLILWFKEMGCSQQAIPPKTSPVLALLSCHYITDVFIWMDQICTCYSINKNSAGAAAGTCQPNKSRSARPFGAWAWDMGKAWLSTASPFQGTADGTVKIKHACRALQFLLLLTFPCSLQSQLDPIHLLPSLSKLNKKKAWYLSFLIFMCLPFYSWYYLSNRGKGEGTHLEHLASWQLF